MHKGPTTRRARHTQFSEGPPPSTPTRRPISSTPTARARASPPQTPHSTAAHSYAAGCTFFGTAMDGCVKEGRHLTEHQGQMLTRELRNAAGVRGDMAGEHTVRPTAATHAQKKSTPSVPQSCLRFLTRRVALLGTCSSSSNPSIL
mmetsp:Transcript_29876/g.59999  ORF Transcript_29876/g.59999 Transcript_29876/m.59999 type:complete len:146 (-) Transcript_29876:35-472(-)